MKKIVIPRFTKETWNVLFNDGNNQKDNINYMYTQKPHNLVDFVTPLMEGLNGDALCKVVTLSDEYLEWLKENKKRAKNHPNTLVNSAFEYASGVSDEKANELLLKSGMNVSRYMMAIPIVCIHRSPGNGTLSSEMRIPQDVCRNLEAKLSAFYDGEFNAIVPGIIKKAVNLKNDQQHETEWVEYILNTSPKNYETLESTQYYDGVNLPITIVFAPAILEYTHKSALISLSEIYEEVINPILDASNGVMTNELSDTLQGRLNTRAQTAVGNPILATDVVSFERDILTEFYENIADSVRGKADFSMMS